MTKIYNFNAGPSMLPKEVLIHVQKELINWKKLGVSVMEISHRNKEFIQLAEETEQNLRDLLNIPNNYKVLFCHGGARAQFAAVPGNLLTGTKNIFADYIDSGYWSHSAFIEAKKYCKPRNINIKILLQNRRYLLPMKQWNISANSSYIHFCSNETIEGISIHENPIFENKIIVADCSSDILSRPIEINKYGLIYASAQKNIGPSGMTIVIIREDLLGNANSYIPSILNYTILSKNKSMFNTPTTFTWYVANLVFKWLKKQGGIKEIYKINKIKADLIYKIIDRNNFYCNDIHNQNRSYMNVCFSLSNSLLEPIFLKESHNAGLCFLKGHRILGGIRASIYNAMPLQGVKELVKFMLYFENHYG